MEIKQVLKSDVGKVVQVHKNSFQGFFLTELGDRFLNLYYNSVRKDRLGILLGFYKEGELYGFAAATTVSKGFNTQLVRRNLLAFSLIGIRLLFTQIPALMRLFKNLSKTGLAVKDNGEYAELLSIGVSDKLQGHGIGKQLLLGVENELKKKGCSTLSLTTDYYNNEKAIGFYQGLGYDIYYDFTAYPNRKMYRMIKNIN